MVNLVPSYNTKRVIGTWVRQGGLEMRPGSYKVTVPVRVTNATDDVIIPAGVYSTGVLNITPGLPSLDIQAPCTDDPDNSPMGWQLVIEITFSDAPAEVYVIPIPVGGGEINLRAVILTSTIPAPQPVLIRDVPGGLATLDADGKVPESQLPSDIGGGIPDGSTLDAILDSTTRKAMTVVERAKLAGIADGATLNASDTALRARSSHTGTQVSTTISDFQEAVQDVVGSFMASATGATVVYNDAANTITISATGTSDLEAIRDAIGVALIGVGVISVAVDDAANTITISSTATVNETNAALRQPSADPDNLIEIGSDGKPYVDGSGIQPIGTYLTPAALDGVLFGWVLEVGQTAANVPSWLPVSGAKNKTIIARKV